MIYPCWISKIVLGVRGLNWKKCVNALGGVALSVTLLGYAPHAHAEELPKQNSVVADIVLPSISDILSHAVALNNDIKSELTKIIEERQRLEEQKRKEAENLENFISSALEHRFEDYDIRTKTNLTGEQLEVVLKGTGLEGLGEAYAKAEQEYGVSAFALIGISAIESKWGTSNFARERNNLFGFQAYDSNLDATKYFKSKEESILYVAKYLSDNYLNPEGKYFHGYTLKDVNVKYASDKSWNMKITYVMNSLVEKLK